MGDAVSAPLALSLAMCDYDRTKPLIDGEVQLERIRLTTVPVSIEASICRMLRDQEFDAAEMSFSAALIAADRGEPDFSILPIFPSRYFRHSAIFVNTSAGIDRPADLRGKTVGVPFYARLAAAVWVRGMLEDDYGVRPEDVDWVVSESLPVGSDDKIPVQLPPEVSIRRVPATPTLDDRLASGEIDALITARLPRPFAEGNPSVARLFADPRTVERDYFERTRIFPPMHVIVVRAPIYARNPWIGPSLFNAFVDAKRIALRRMYEIDVPRYSLAWWVLALEEERDVLGLDPWTYGVPGNIKTIETFIDYCFRQGLLSRRPTIEETFPDNLLAVEEGVQLGA